MSKLKCVIIAALLAIPGGWALRAQTSRPASLAAADYIEIQQLVARYPYAVDMHGGDGSAYAALFTPDGSFGTQAKGTGPARGARREDQQGSVWPGVHPSFRHERRHQAVAGRRDRAVVSRCARHLRRRQADHHPSRWAL